MANHKKKAGGPKNKYKTVKQKAKGGKTLPSKTKKKNITLKLKRRFRKRTAAHRRIQRWHIRTEEAARTLQSIFALPNDPILVPIDHQLWNRIIHQLPPGYMIPDMSILQPLRQHTAR